jgi:hypothetical protein
MCLMISWSLKISFKFVNFVSFGHNDPNVPADFAELENLIKVHELCNLCTQ